MQQSAYRNGSCIRPGIRGCRNAETAQGAIRHKIGRGSVSGVANSRVRLSAVIGKESLTVRKQTAACGRSQQYDEQAAYHH